MWLVHRLHCSTMTFNQIAVITARRAISPASHTASSTRDHMINCQFLHRKFLTTVLTCEPVSQHQIISGKTNIMFLFDIFCRDHNRWHLHRNARRSNSPILIFLQNLSITKKRNLNSFFPRDSRNWDDA